MSDIDDEDMPPCPLCDNPIHIMEDARIIQNGELKGLAHDDCVEEMTENKDD